MPHKKESKKVIMGSWTQQFAMIPRIVAKDPNLSLQQKGLYTLAISFAKPSKDGLYMYAGIDLLAKITGLSNSYISRLLSGLCKENLIIRKRKNGTSSRTYFLDPSERYSSEELAVYELDDSINLNYSGDPSSTIVTVKDSKGKEEKEEGTTASSKPKNGVFKEWFMSLVSWYRTEIVPLGTRPVPELTGKVWGAAGRHFKEMAKLEEFPLSEENLPLLKKQVESWPKRIRSNTTFNWLFSKDDLGSYKVATSIQAAKSKPQDTGGLQWDPEFLKRKQEWERRQKEENGG